MRARDSNGLEGRRNLARAVTLEGDVLQPLKSFSPHMVFRTSNLWLDKYLMLLVMAWISIVFLVNDDYILGTRYLSITSLMLMFIPS